MTEVFRVLIVDDNQSLTYILRDRINQTEQFEIVGIAHNGDEAIELINVLKPDLVILDIVMPKTDGLAVLEHYKNNHDIEFIVLSAIGHDLVTKRAVSLGAMYYLIKPFEINILLERMESLLLGKVQAKAVLNPEHNENAIASEIALIGVPMHVKGYQYIKEAISIALALKDLSFKITKMIYPVIAERHNTTSTSVERAIRNAIDLTIARADREFLNQYFNHELFNNKVTNKEFIIRITNAVKQSI